MYIEKALDLLSSAHEKRGQKQKCCVYNFGQCIIYIDQCFLSSEMCCDLYSRATHIM